MATNQRADSSHLDWDFSAWLFLAKVTQRWAVHLQYVEIALPCCSGEDAEKDILYCIHFIR
jgi:hypothetical protein